MGNICCDNDEQFNFHGKSRITKKRALNNPQTKRNYQQELESILNLALQRYKEKYHITNLTIKSIIGKGGQGMVFLVEVDSSDGIIQGDYAMKRISKDQLDCARTKQALILQKQILISSDTCTFISQILFACQDKKYLYYVMDFAKGGDAFTLIKGATKKVKEFVQTGEFGVKFLLACCILGIQYLHEHEIIYRDLKPENILLFQDGYPKLADFGIAKKKQNTKDNNLFYDIAGTVLYFSPQIILKKGYDKSTDLWALGILTYQLLFLETPFTAQCVKSPIFYARCTERQINPQWPQKKVSQDAKNFINAMLKCNPKQRLGFKQIKQHAFFHDFDWKSFQQRKMQSPLKQLINKHAIEIRSMSVIEQSFDQSMAEKSQKNFTWTWVREGIQNNNKMQQKITRSQDDQF